MTTLAFGSRSRISLACPVAMISSPHPMSRPADPAPILDELLARAHLDSLHRKSHSREFGCQIAPHAGMLAVNAGTLGPGRKPDNQQLAGDRRGAANRRRDIPGLVQH